MNTAKSEPNVNNQETRNPMWGSSMSSQLDATKKGHRSVGNEKTTTRKYDSRLPNSCYAP